MKITFKNFRCHKNCSFDIPDEGLVLLSGESGIGKTTIFDGISHALYGNAKKPYSHGTTTCKVTLEYKGLVITRSNRPNRLIVQCEEIEYEDEVAQGVIDSHFGMNAKEFSTSSYVVQSLNNSVISMSPADQLKFIETVAFKNEDHIRYKQLAKEKEKEYSLKVSSLRGKISVLEEELEKKEASQEKILIDHELTHEEAVKNKDYLIKELNDSEKEILIAEKKREKVTKILADRKNLEQKLEFFRENIQNCDAKIKKIGLCDPREIEELRKKVKLIETKVKNTEKYESHISQLEKAKTAKEIFVNQLNSDLKKIEEELPNETELNLLYESEKNLSFQKEKFDEEQKTIEQYDLSKKKREEIIRDTFFSAKEHYPSELENVKTRKELLKFLTSEEKKETKRISLCERNVINYRDLSSKQEVLGEIYKCPSCETSLRFNKGELCTVLPEKVSEKIPYEQKIEKEEQDKNKYKENLRKIETWKSNLFNLPVAIGERPKLTVEYNEEEASSIREKCFLFRKMEQDKGNILKKMENLPNSISKLFEIANSKLKDLPKNFKASKNISSLKKELETNKDRIKKYEYDKSNIEELELEKEKLYGEVKLVENSLQKLKTDDSTPISHLNEIIKNKKGKYSEISGKLTEAHEIIEDVIIFENQMKQISDITSISDKLNKLEEKLKTQLMNLEGAIGLGSAVVEAEVLSMNSTLESINNTASEYLSEFFEDSIYVRLENHKKDLKGNFKAQINTFVEYKGHQYANINELSGGELQRCELAFILAVNDIFGSPIILLDECLNNLDAEINMEALSCLKELGTGKLILVVSHEAVHGVFDDIVNL